MPIKAAILVSVKSEIYSNLRLFAKILTKAVSEVDEVYLIIEDSLWRWNMSSANMNTDTALVKSIADGDSWCKELLPTVYTYLGEKFKGCYRWEELRNNPKTQYKNNQQAFNLLCNKQKVLKILDDIFSKLNINSIEDLVKNEDGLKKEKGILLLATSSSQDTYWQKLSWENAMAASILEYTIRHFTVASISTNLEYPHLKDNFKEFLVTIFCSNAYEHQAEEAIMLYEGLILNDLKFQTLYYPNKISPILKKASIEFIKEPGLLRWVPVKIDTEKEPDLARQLYIYFQGIPNMSKAEKEALVRYVIPIATLMSTKQSDKRMTIAVSLIGFFSTTMLAIQTPPLTSSLTLEAEEIRTNAENSLTIKSSQQKIEPTCLSFR